MPLIRNAQHDQMPRRATVLDLGDLQRQAESMAEKAKSHVESILAEGRSERAKLIAGAADQGRKQGHAEGLAKGLEEGRKKGREEAQTQAKPQIDALVRSWDTAMKDFEKRRDAMLSDARADVLRLAVAIAERVIKRSVTIDPSIVTAQVEAALGMVMSPSRLVVRVHPDDLAATHSAMPTLLERLQGSAQAEVVGDPAITRGSCVVTTDKGRIDATLESQLDKLVDALLPGDASAKTRAPDSTSAGGPPAIGKAA